MDELSLGDWLDRWLELYAKNSIKLSTYISYETYIRRHIKPALGQILMKDLTIGDLQKFLTDKLVQGRADGQEGGLSAKTVQNIHKMLLPALEQAKMEGILTENLAAGVNPPKVEQKEMRVLSLEEQKRFVAACMRLQEEEPNALACRWHYSLGRVWGRSWGCSGRMCPLKSANSN